MKSRPVSGKQERFLAEFILSPIEGLEMTSERCIVIANEERDLSQTEPLPKFTNRSGIVDIQLRKQ
jgi:hypothetical protein